MHAHPAPLPPPSSSPPAARARPVELRVTLASKIFAANLLTVGASVALLMWVAPRGDEWQAAFVVLLPVAIGAWVVARRLTRPLEGLVRTARAVGAGDLAHTAPPEPGRTWPDEVDLLAAAVGAMVEDLRGLADQLKRTAGAVDAAAGRVVEHTRAVGADAEALHKQSAEVAARSAEQSSRARTQGQTVGRVADSLRRAAAATRGTETSRHALGRVRSAFEQVGEAGEAVVRFSEETAEIHAVVEVISQIAEQTHLLSVNASIEAARAGDAGRGFAVVAEEIRRLADAAARSAERIQVLVRTLDGHTRTVVGTMQSSTRELSAGRSEVDEIARTLDRIAAAAGREAEKAESLSALARTQAGLIDEVVAGADASRAGADHIVAAAQAMKDASVAQRSRGQALGEAAGTLASVAAELGAATGRFRV
jgi:methyl-accepting chemotaxis protein